jgi:outer membrane immunogenic protein
MRSLNFAALAAALVLAASAAQAADFPNSYSDQSYAPPVEEAWTGFYAGGLLGYGFGDAGGFEPDGFLGGLTAGMNYQIDQVLLGAEADIAMAGISEDGPEDYSMDWVGTMRGRIGYAFDRFVVFGTGGFAWTNAEFDGPGGDDSNFHGGWTVGAGLEAALTGNISAKVDYLYMDFSDELYSGGGSIEPELHTVRVGVNYKF